MKYLSDQRHICLCIQLGNVSPNIDVLCVINLYNGRIDTATCTLAKSFQRFRYWTNYERPQSMPIIEVEYKLFPLCYHCIFPYIFMREVCIANDYYRIWFMLLSSWNSQSHICLSNACQSMGHLPKYDVNQKCSAFRPATSVCFQALFFDCIITTIQKTMFYQRICIRIANNTNKNPIEATTTVTYIRWCRENKNDLFRNKKQIWLNYKNWHVLFFRSFDIFNQQNWAKQIRIKCTTNDFFSPKKLRFFVI